ncbi:MAG: terminase family protein [Clostridiales bacterium]|jgi:phage terminase large subunit-like protein|nr:terminase family protein [Clostridiales bacterium]
MKNNESNQYINDINLLSQIAKIDNLISQKMQDDKILYYNTGQKIHHKQLEFAKSPYRNRWVFGGNRSGKTECGAVECVWMARGIHPYRANKPSVHGWVVSLSSQVSRDVAQSKILNYLNPAWIKDIVMSSGSSHNPSNGVVDFVTVYSVLGGVSKIGFKSCEMGRDKFAGTSLDFVWFDEEPPYDIYQECRMRVLDRSGDIFGTMTPLLGLTWVYNNIYLNPQQDPKIWHIFMEWGDNPYLDKQEIDALTASMTQQELDSRRYGKFVNSGGMVYSEFDSNVHVIDPFDVPKEWYNNLSIDPGLNNPLSCHWYAVDYDDVVYVIAEHYQAGKDIQYHANAIKSISQSLDWHTDWSGRIVALIDSAANQRTLASSKSVADLFWDHGIAVNTKVNKDLFAGINTVKRYFGNSAGRPQIYIFRTCVNLIREIKSYWWGNGDTPIKRDDHALDELRYFLMSRPQSPKIPTTSNIISAYKDKLIKKNNKHN